MFLGEFEYSCDEKNRVRIPNKFRIYLKGEFILTKGNDGCIFALPKDYFSSILQKTNELPMFSSIAQKPLRLLFSSACEYFSGVLLNDIVVFISACFAKLLKSSK